MAYASWSVVFGEQPTASKWNILGTNDAHFYSFLGDNTAWQTYTPSITSGITLGDGTISGRYTVVGKTVHFTFRLVCGSTTSLGVGTDMIISLPVTASTALQTQYASNIGLGVLLDAVDPYLAVAQYYNTTTLVIQAPRANAAGNPVKLTAANTTNWPAFASGDVLTITGKYQAA